MPTSVGDAHPTLSDHRPLTTIIHRLVNICWFFFKWGLILGVIGAALAVAFFYHRMDDEIRRRVESRLAQQYPNLRLTIRTAVLVKGEGIEIRGLSILEPGAEGPGAELLTIDECFFGCSTDLQELLTSEPSVTRVILRRPTLRATRRPDGTWSAARLLPLPKLSRHPPTITIENGTIEVFDPLKAPASTLTLRDVNMTMTPAEDADGLPAEWAHCRRVQGTFSSDYLRQVVFEGLVDPHRPEFAISGSTEGLEVCPEMSACLPGTLARDLAVLGVLRGQGDLRFRARYDPSSPVPLAFEVSGQVTRGRVDDPRLPHPLTDIQARVQVDNDGYRIDDLTARSNQATLRLSCRGSGFGPASPLSLEAEIRQLELDQQILDALPPSWQAQWRKYDPKGRIDVDARLCYDGQTWTPELRVRCLNVSLSHHKFPYRLERGTGTLELVENMLQANLRLRAYSGDQEAYSDNQVVTIEAKIVSPMSRPTGWIQATGPGLALDQKFVAALPNGPQTLAKSLDLRGTIGRFSYRLWRDAPEEPFHQHLTAEASRCWIRYDRFPYSLANIQGDLEMLDGKWFFRNLKGTNGGARVACEGTLAPAPEGNELFLRLVATNVAMEDELRDALKPAMRQVWQSLRPRGIVDLVAEIRYIDASRRFDLSVRAEPRSEVSSIEPICFPYRLDKIQGILSYRGGRVTLERFKAEHGATRASAGGFCDFLPDGGWHLHLGQLTLDRLRVDRDLVQAVPARLKNALVELNPIGPLTLRGDFDLARAGGPQDRVKSQWGLTIGLQQVTADCGVRLDNIHGGINVRGGFDGRSFYCLGDLALDSLSYKDWQFTEVQGPLWIDDGQVLFGRGAEQRQNESGLREVQGPRPLRSVSAKLCGGTVYGDARIALGPQPGYAIRAWLVGADLARLAQEVIVGRQNLRGRIDGDLVLRGAGRNRNAMKGEGTIRLREANVYELPLMISMLKILSIRAPDPNAFSKSDIAYRIEGEHIYFDRLDFIGDAISLLGKGEMNFQSEIRLAFTAIVGRGELGMPVLRNLFTGASQQFMLIHVGGTLQNPETRKEPFPGVNQAIQQLQAEGRRAGME